MIADTRCHSFNCNVLCFVRHKRRMIIIRIDGNAQLHRMPTDLRRSTGSHSVDIHTYITHARCTRRRSASMLGYYSFLCFILFLVFPSLCSSFEWLREYSNFAFMVRFAVCAPSPRTVLYMSLLIPTHNVDNGRVPFQSSFHLISAEK